MNERGNKLRDDTETNGGGNKENNFQETAPQRYNIITLTISRSKPSDRPINA